MEIKGLSGPEERVGKTPRAPRPKSKAQGRAGALGRKAAKSPDDVDALYAWFDAMVEEEGAQNALRKLWQFARATHASAPWMALGYAAFGVGRSDLGVRAFRQARRHGAGEPAIYGLSVGLTVSGKPREAIQLLERERKKAPLGGRLATAIANAYLSVGAHTRAGKALDGLTPHEASEWKDMLDSAKARVAQARARAK